VDYSCQNGFEFVSQSCPPRIWTGLGWNFFTYFNTGWFLIRST